MVVTTKREAWRVARAQARVRPEDFEAAGAPTGRGRRESVEDAVLRAEPATTGSGSTSTAFPSGAGPCCG